MDTALRFKETAAGQSLVFYTLPQKINPQLRLGQFDLLDGVGVSRVWTGTRRRMVVLMNVFLLI